MPVSSSAVLAGLGRASMRHDGIAAEALTRRLRHAMLAIFEWRMPASTRRLLHCPRDARNLGELDNAEPPFVIARRNTADRSLLPVQRIRVAKSQDNSTTRLAGLPLAIPSSEGCFRAPEDRQTPWTLEQAPALMKPVDGSEAEQKIWPVLPGSDHLECQHEIYIAPACGGLSFTCIIPRCRREYRRTEMY